VVAEVPVVNEVTPSQPEALKPEAARQPPVPKPVPAPTAAAPAPAPASPPPPAVAAKTTAPAAKAPAPVASPVQPPRPPPVAAAPPVAPPLDLAGLESRLRDTKAIGVMTKLALKNQVDDLLDRFRSQHRGRQQDPAGPSCAQRMTGC
jgi:hypothetical protein